MRFAYPVPRITESFVDLAVETAGGRRLSPAEREEERSPNADYLLPGAVGELKILEEEGLEKAERQSRVAALFEQYTQEDGEVDIDVENAPPEIKHRYRRLLGGPIQKAVKKAADQIKVTKLTIARPYDLGVLIAVNNGYGSLPATEFDYLVLHSAKNDTSQIDLILTVTVSHHSGSFDSYIFCTPNVIAVRGGIEYPALTIISDAIGDQFGEGMAQMMRGVSPAHALPPIRDILFERNGVRFIRRAWDVPDSRGTEQP
jgi:hypothetical protein